MKALLKNNKYGIYIDYIQLNSESEPETKPSKDVINFLNVINKFWKRYNCTYDDKFIYIKDHPVHYKTASTYEYVYNYNDGINRYLIFGNQGSPSIITEDEFKENFEIIIFETSPSASETENGLYVTKVPFELDYQEPENPEIYNQDIGYSEQDFIYQETESDDDYSTIANFLN